jgi:protein TonB
MAWLQQCFNRVRVAALGWWQGKLAAVSLTQALRVSCALHLMLVVLWQVTRWWAPVPEAPPADLHFTLLEATRPTRAVIESNLLAPKAQAARTEKSLEKVTEKKVAQAAPRPAFQAKAGQVPPPKTSPRPAYLPRPPVTTARQAPATSPAASASEPPQPPTDGLAPNVDVEVTPPSMPPASALPSSTEPAAVLMAASAPSQLPAVVPQDALDAAQQPPSPEVPTGTEGATQPALRASDFAPFMQQLQQRLTAAWRPPRQNQKQRVVVRLEIAKNGTVLAMAVEKSSGNEAVDRAALEAVARAAPFDPLPDVYPGGSVPVLFTFDYHLYAFTGKGGPRRI